MSRLRFLVLKRLLFTAVAWIGVLPFAQATAHAQNDAPRWRAHSSWNFVGIRVGWGVAAGNRDQVNWVEFTNNGPVYHTINMDTDPFYAWAPSVALQVGHMTRSHLFVMAEVGYTRVLFEDRVRIPGAGQVAVAAEPLHGKYIKAQLGADLLGARLSTSRWALNVAIFAQAGEISTEFISSGGGGATAAGVVISADRVMHRSPVTGAFNTLSPYLEYNFASHNWPRYVTWGLALHFHRK